jgi:ABC-type phosphate transport system substrate-binding protein
VIFSQLAARILRAHSRSVRVARSKRWADEANGVSPGRCAPGCRLPFYPIVSFSWLLLYENYQDRQKSVALKDFIRWGLSRGQSYSPELGYVALPADVAELSRAALERVN